MDRFGSYKTNENMMKYMSNNLCTGISKGGILQLIGSLANVIGDSIGFYGQIISLIEDEQDSREQQLQQQQMQDQIDELQKQLLQQQQDQQQKEKDFQQQINEINLYPIMNPTNLPSNKSTCKNQNNDLNEQIQALQQQMCITQQNQENQLKLLHELLKEFKND